MGVPNGGERNVCVCVCVCVGTKSCACVRAGIEVRIPSPIKNHVIKCVITC